jgi:hypothetical protein
MHAWASPALQKITQDCEPPSSQRQRYILTELQNVRIPILSAPCAFSPSASTPQLPPNLSTAPVANEELTWIGYKQIEDIRGECDTMNKKSLIARLRGDAELAEDWARKYVSLYEGHFSKLSDDEDDTEEEDEAEVDD